MVKKVLALVLALSMCFALGVTAFAENATTASDTKATYTADYYYTDIQADYKITTPTSIIAVKSTETPAVTNCTIQGVCAKDVSLETKSSTVSMAVSGSSLSTDANVTFAKLTLSANIVEAKTVTGAVSAKFPADKNPLVKGDYEGTIQYTVSVAA